MKAPGTKRLKLNYDEQLPILLQLCFHIQLAPLHLGDFRSNSQALFFCPGGATRLAEHLLTHIGQGPPDWLIRDITNGMPSSAEAYKVGRCRLIPV